MIPTILECLIPPRDPGIIPQQGDIIPRLGITVVLGDYQGLRDPISKVQVGLRLESSIFILKGTVDGILSRPFIKLHTRFPTVPESFYPRSNSEDIVSFYAKSNSDIFHRCLYSISPQLSINEKSRCKLLITRQNKKVESLKGFLVNRAFLSLHGGSSKITTTVSLRNIFKI